MASADPSAVHPEYDRPTPENFEEWSQEQLEEWERRNEEEMLGEVRSEREKLEEDQQKALDALRSPEQVETEPVTIDDLEFRVKTHANKEIEDTLMELAEAHSGPETAADLRMIRKQVPAMLAWFVVDPEEYADPAVWRAYGEEFGIGELTKAYLRAVEPYLDANEQDRAVQKFREVDRRGRTG